MKNLFIGLLLLISTSLFAQDSTRVCGTSITKENAKMLNSVVEEKILDPQLTDDLTNALRTIKIPVVVHIVWNDSVQNISDEQINSQMIALNEDFRARNKDIDNVPIKYKNLVADFKIKFVLKGVTRTHTDRREFAHQDGVKSTLEGGIDPWNTKKYLNIWVCDLYEGLLGYAQFPGEDSITDGVVMDYEAFGTGGTAQEPYHMGRVCSHEIGHWLGLYHIWGDDCGWFDTDQKCDGDDMVKDTPLQSCPSRGCPSANIGTCGSQDMWMNFMDYTSDECTWMFTKGQRKRAWAVLMHYRWDIYKLF